MNPIVMKMDVTHPSSRIACQMRIISLLPDDEDVKKKQSTIGRLLRTVNLRKSGRKYTYKQHDGRLDPCDAPHIQSHGLPATYLSAFTVLQEI